MIQKSQVQSMGAAAVRAKGRLTLERARQYSAAGYTKQEAAKALGISRQGLEIALLRGEGTTTWPIAESSHD